MGADIHVYVERLNNDGDWERIYTTDMQGEIVDWYSRDYTLFCLLSNVRGNSDCPYTETKGLPRDISKDVKEKYDEYAEDWHSATWYSRNELRSMIDWAWNEYKMNQDLFIFWCYNGAFLKNEDGLCSAQEMKDIINDYLGAYHSLYDFTEFCQNIANINLVYDDIRVIVWFDS